MVLEAVSRGLLDKEIADELHMSRGTVRVHLLVIFARLAVKNRVQAAVRYVRALAEMPMQE
jgi:two-component system nitrate/nitrite response regulator NarP